VREREDVGRAQESADALREQLAGLEAEFAAAKRPRFAARSESPAARGINVPGRKGDLGATRLVLIGRLMRPRRSAAEEPGPS
jgi:hypothetical protein